MLDPRITAILDFWCMPRDHPHYGKSRDIWFVCGPAFDSEIRRRFGREIEQALKRRLDHWIDTPEGALALVLLLDQFTRNVHRGQARAFAGDARAQRLSLQAHASGLDAELATVGLVFLAIPLMHAEDLDLQHECVRRFQRLLDTCPPELEDTLARHLHFAELHRDIVARFGRFPHRNAALGRTSTPAEETFLKDGPRFGQ
jgi:uncharacterized protein (DUF924 family)